ncbi:M20 metallopeptidase family protein [Thermoflavifilum thermophilum]|uniref:Hippurate hydrolase n=1 Tax=Thermoflavifilum thermophilum TaxID=1393122 RepID=A0A1I7NDI7_9BACT|nr:M20 family metallopeptidase [Thermoflavifilum thermophilum]SFV32701.1 hippurate hydrolase [Thermoflavifilum thermophilum]
MLAQVKSLAREIYPQLIAIRHHLHQHPELSFQEHQTMQFIIGKLQEWGIPYRAPVAGTGVVGLIEGQNPQSRIVALRADIDALPIEEANDVPYRSQHPGVMHACGHDVHTTCLLGAAYILQQLRREWQGTVKLIFQPGEEKHPGGASLMIRDGALENPRPSCILGMHVHPELPVGYLGFRSGISMASADEIYITIRGKGGHAASPHLTTDTILAASHVVVALQQVISRQKDPFSPSVLSICAFNGGYTTNVIPTEVKLLGTFRAMNETWRFRAHELIRNTVQHVTQAMGAEAEVEIPVGYPCLVNDEQVTTAARRLAEQYLDAAHVKDVDPRMGAEDFAFYSQVIPACFFRLGVAAPEKGVGPTVHTPQFDIDERAIEIGAGIMAWLGAHIQQ